MHDQILCKKCVLIMCLSLSQCIVCYSYFQQLHSFWVDSQLFIADMPHFGEGVRVHGTVGGQGCSKNCISAKKNVVYLLRKLNTTKNYLLTENNYDTKHN